MIKTTAALSARPHADPLADCAGTWWVAVTRPRYEDRLVRDLRYVDGSAIVVQEKVERVEYDEKGHRHRHIEQRKLFPGYVFCNGGDDLLYGVRGSIAMIQVIEVRDQQRLHRELGSILRAVEACRDLSTAKIRAGSRAVITQGPLIGLEGVVIENSPGRVYLQMSILGSAVELPPQFVESMN